MREYGASELVECKEGIAGHIVQREEVSGEPHQMARQGGTRN